MECAATWILKEEINAGHQVVRSNYYLPMMERTFPLNFQLTTFIR
jgi:hypothetical protein